MSAAGKIFWISSLLREKISIFVLKIRQKMTKNVFSSKNVVYETKRFVKKIFFFTFSTKHDRDPEILFQRKYFFNETRPGSRSRPTLMLWGVYPVNPETFLGVGAEFHFFRGGVRSGKFWKNLFWTGVGVWIDSRVKYENSENLYYFFKIQKL